MGPDIEYTYEAWLLTKQCETS